MRSIQIGDSVLDWEDRVGVVIEDRQTLIGVRSGLGDSEMLDWIPVAEARLLQTKAEREAKETHHGQSKV